MATKRSNSKNGNNTETPAIANVDAKAQENLERDKLMAAEFNMPLEDWQKGVAGDTYKTPDTATQDSNLEESEDPEVKETALTSIQWSSIKPEIDDLDVDGLKEVIDYCSNRIDELQREEVEALEAQMRAIQDKLMAMGARKAVAETPKNGYTRFKNVAPIINPANPEQQYTLGKVPGWLAKMMEETGKKIVELRPVA